MIDDDLKWKPTAPPEDQTRPDWTGPVKTGGSGGSGPVWSSSSQSYRICSTDEIDIIINISFTLLIPNWEMMEKMMENLFISQNKIVPITHRDTGPRLSF